jgi:hypothetical protein
LKRDGNFIIDLSQDHYKTGEFYTYAELNIGAGSKKRCIDFNLDSIEKELLAYQLADWLELPITKKLGSQKREKKIFPSL